MKTKLLALFVGLLMVGCEESSTPSDPVDSPKGIDLDDNETLAKIIAEANEFQGGITKLELSIGENDDGKKEITIQKHPIDSFNGKYLEQNRIINGTSYFRNKNDRYLYFYDQAEGGEKGWSLDHRNPDGVKDYYSGGWFYLEKFRELEESSVNWLSVPNLKDGNGVIVYYNEDGTESYRITYKDGEIVKD